VNQLERIWNLDETGFCLDLSKVKTVGAVGVSATRTMHGSGRENISVLMACSATGIKGPPLTNYINCIIIYIYCADHKTAGVWYRRNQEQTTE